MTLLALWKMIDTDPEPGERSYGFALFNFHFVECVITR